MRRLAFLTTDLGPAYVTDDHLAVPHLRERGVDAAFTRWRERVDWSAYDLVVVRSTWDYQRDLARFLDTLAAIAAATRLENALPLQQWNVRKTYLRDLAAEGVPVVPTVWRDGLLPDDLAGLFASLDSEQIVLKPVVGSSGEDTFLLAAGDAARRETELLRVFDGRPLMAQPFLDHVRDEGERSIVWIDGVVSHGIRKTPRAGEFRSQEEHGGRVESVEVAGALAEAAARVAAAIAARAPAPPLYGRVDFLPGPDGPLVGELELVEPSLYLRTHPDAPARLAKAIAARLGS